MGSVPAPRDLSAVATVTRWLAAARHSRGAWYELGWTIVEMVLVVAIFGTLLAMVTPQVTKHIDQARVARAILDIEGIQADLAGVEMLGEGLPETLAEIGRDMLDPWGNPYQYLRFERGKPVPPGARRDRFLVPINTSYDLYSMGKDGATTVALTAKPSQDDVVRANDGAFIGLAVRY